MSIDPTAKLKIVSLEDPLAWIPTREWPANDYIPLEHPDVSFLT